MILFAASNTFDLGTLLGLLVSIACIVICSIDLASYHFEASITALIFVLLSLAFALYYEGLISLVGTYGYYYPLAIVFLGYSAIVLHKSIFDNKNRVPYVGNQGQTNQNTSMNVTKKTNPVEELEKLHDLKEKNLITQDEYNLKRLDLISKL